MEYMLELALFVINCFGCGDDLAAIPALPPSRFPIIGPPVGVYYSEKVLATAFWADKFSINDRRFH